MPHGRTHPLGVSLEAGLANVSVYSEHAEAVELVLYDEASASQPRRVLPLERTGHYWHTVAEDIEPGQIYAFRAHGPHRPEHGLHFDGDKVLLDPYGRAVAIPREYRRLAAAAPGRNDAFALKSCVCADGDYDWNGDRPLHRPFSQTVIYELHVGGFTKHPSSGVPTEHRGTFRGVVDKIPYLRDLGITAVELMPVFQFDWQRAPEGRVNYWGYAPVSFFAPHHAYATTSDPRCAAREFRDMVKALHAAGIEVILDVVFGQTGEGGRGGANISLRGLDSSTYFMLEDDGRFANYSGTGNTLNANQAVVRRLILDSLRYWVEHMHVDGFRFDLAAVLSRDPEGNPLPQPPVLWDIESDPVLAGTKLIAEAWDAAGLYQVGSFFGDSWKEWNGQFRDDVRSFVRGDDGMVPALVNRLLGSPDLYGQKPRDPEQSINFITSHDGFTLNDLVSYDRKHNLANGEDDRDGHDDNRSWNHGIEGPTEDPDIEALRHRQVKNLLTLCILSLGAPMLLMGDEMRRTQLGNNNAYCQDSELSWLDWALLDRYADLHRFVRELIRVRFLRESVRFDHHLTLAELREQAQVRLHGVSIGRPDLSHDSRSLGLSATTLSGELHMYYAANAWSEHLDFEIPTAPGTRGWRRIIDTSLPSPDDIRPMAEAAPVNGRHYRVAPRSIVALVARRRE